MADDFLQEQEQEDSSIYGEFTENLLSDVVFYVTFYLPDIRDLTPSEVGIYEMGNDDLDNFVMPGEIRSHDRNWKKKLVFFVRSAMNEDEELKDRYKEKWWWKA